jgi:spermidine/putrescine transport system substrate-binding protein
MSKSDDNKPITAKKFMKEFNRYQKGSISRRQFFGITGLGTAMAAMGAAMPSLLWPGQAHAADDLGDRLVFATWPNYHNPGVLANFTNMTGVNLQGTVFGSNEEMLAKLQAGGTGWDVMEITNYTITNYVALDLIQELDLSKIPNYDAASNNPKFVGPSTVNGKVYCLPKNWGHTGFVVNTKKIKSGPKSWKDFFDVTMGEGSGHTMVHDYQLTTIGAALCALGYSFNSIDVKELAEAEALLIKSKPHLFAITSDYQPGMRSGDGWMSICWNGDGTQLKNDMPEMEYVLGTDGGEIWADFYAIPKDAPNQNAAYAFINYMLDPSIQALEAWVHGYAPIDSRPIALQPESLGGDPILHPAEELMNGLEFGAAQTLTDPTRAEVMARFKSA